MTKTKSKTKDTKTQTNSEHSIRKRIEALQEKIRFEKEWSP